jgi:hypothetical protein
LINVRYLGRKFIFPILASGLFSVDVFFYMSGFMFCLGFQKYLNKMINKIQLLAFALFHRYVIGRYLFIILGIGFILPFLGSGAIFEYVVILTDKCTSNFWYNLLYINNFTDRDSMCSGHTWYLANDMQFFLISIILFIFLNKGKIQIMIINVIIALLFIVSIIVQIFICLNNKYWYSDYNHHVEDNETFFNNYYIKPRSMITPYILGLYFCELFLDTPLFREEKKEDKEDMSILQKVSMFFINNNIASFALFIISLVLIKFTIFYAYLTNNYDIPLFINDLMR